MPARFRQLHRATREPGLCIPVADELKALPWVAGYIAGRTAVRYVNLTPDESPYECGQRWTVEAVPWQSPGAGGHPTSTFP